MISKSSLSPQEELPEENNKQGGVFAAPPVFIGEIEMREVNVTLIRDAVRDMCIKANKVLPEDLTECIQCCKEKESNSTAKGIFEDMTENTRAAKQLDIPVCQDTGMAVIFLEIGQQVMLTGGSLEAAVNEGVAAGYTGGLLRCSVVADPLRRVNTGDNTPAVLHTRIVDGDRVTITVAPKGFGSENMSRLKMLVPAQGRQGVLDFIVETAKLAGGNPCPPMVLGVGVGGDFEQCALLAKKALCRPVSERNGDEFYASLEAEALEKINALGIGPQGFGGDCTALAINVEYAPTHIAGLPVAVNVGCHVTRHIKFII